MNILGWGAPGGWELLAVLFAILLLFGAKKLPELSRSLGKSLGEFKKGQQEGAAPDEKEEPKEISESDESEKKADKE